MGWLAGWNYRKSHDITGAANAGTNYQMRVIVHYGAGADSGEDVYLNGKCETDFGDIRFTDDDGTTELDYWMESKVDSDNAVIWVEVKDDLDSNQSIYIYYGKSGESTTSDGEATFLLYDDFLSAVLDLAKWVDISQAAGVVDPTVDYLEMRSNAGSNTAARIESVNGFTGGLRILVQWNPYQKGTVELKWNSQETLREAGGLYSYAGFGKKGNVNEGFYVRETYNSVPYEDSDVVGLTANIWRDKQTRFDDNLVEHWIDDNGTPYTQTVTPLQGSRIAQSHKVWIEANNWNAGSGTVICRWKYFCLMKYTNPEPAHSTWGNEESLLKPSGGIVPIMEILGMI